MKIDNNKIKVGLIGTGGWGCQYVDILHKSSLFELRICFDINKKLLENICSKVRCTAAGSMEELLRYEKLEGVIISTPNFLHYEQCIAAIRAGKHVFVEKPIANTVEEAKKIYEMAKDKNLIIAVGHNVRRRSEFRAIKKMLEDGEIGNVAMVEANSSQYIGENREMSWRLNKSTCPGGPLLQLGIHHIDTLRYLFGDIAEVKSYLKDEYFKSEAPDTILSIFLFKSGTIGYLGTNYISEPSFTMRIYGTKGNLIAEDGNLHIQRGRISKRIKTKYINTLLEEINEFGECIRKGDKPEVEAKEALENLAIVEAIMDTSEDKGRRI